MKIYLSFLLGTLGFFFSCIGKADKNISSARQGTRVKGTIISDSNAAPEIVPLTAENEPKVSLIGNPKTKSYSFSPESGKIDITYLDAADGIPEAPNYSLLQDSTGNLWLGNETGLVKYDGKEIVLFLKDNLSGLYNPGLIMNLLEDRHGNIFSYGSGMGKYDGMTLSTVKVIDSIRADDGFRGSMIRDNAGDLWLSIPRKGIARYNGKEVRLYDGKDGIARFFVNDITMDNTGNIYIAQDSVGILKFDGNRFNLFIKREELPGEFNANAIQFDKTGNAWLGSFYHGLVKYDKQKKVTQFTTKNGLASNQILRISKDSSGAIWIPQGVNGITRIDSAGFRTFTKTDGILSFSNNFSSIATGKMGIIWVGGEGTVNRLDNHFINFEDIFKGLGDGLVFVNGISSMIRSNNGNYWISHYGMGVIRYDGKTMTGYTKTSGLADGMVRRIMEDRSGNTWFTTLRGISKFDGQSFKSYTKANGLKSDGTNEILEDHSGNIWFSSGNTLSKFDGQSFSHYHPFTGMNRNQIRRIFEDSKGNIWVGYRGKGVCRFDGKTFTNYSMSDGLADSTVTSITEDDFGNIWFGSGKGLNRFDRSTMYRYTTDDGLSTNDIERIIKDTVNHEYWLQTGSGLTRLSITANHPDSVFFLNFDKRSGFPVSPGFSFVDKDGKIWLTGGGDKLTSFDYPGLKKQMGPFSLHIKNISINNEKICWSNLLPASKMDSMILRTEMQLKFGRPLSNDDLKQMTERYRGIRFDSLLPFDYLPQNLVLPYSANSISFDFAAIDPYFSKFTHYQYMLEGFEKTWSPLNKNSVAGFGNLREGNYTFKLKALNPYGIWSEMSYSFKVLPPWSRTWWAYAVYVLVFLSGIFLFIRWRTKALQIEKILLERKVSIRTEELNRSLENLKSTQSQLIHAEKMASLGELTAGIAHEIQNPLNFVNNFSELNTELINELVEEADKGNTAEVKSIAADLKENSEKITHHGKRADAIVKGMLQHSSSGSGKKEATDLNALCDEYLRLAYHGLRAKDKSFNATMKTDFDPGISKVNIIPQDIGRVVLNLITNAFYAVNEKAKAIQPSDLTAEAAATYQPTVEVSTRKEGNKILVNVKDNGGGIPPKILDKIFQPFFTTKPTGQGTGLGLSMSYDIITKGHGGELKVETIEGEGTTFVIQIPVS
jgi:signal transduction histidine kinase/ligand-binding sensor domain-containing protein